MSNINNYTAMSRRISKVFKTEKNKKSYMEKLEEANSAPILDNVHIHVEWKKNRTWGWNPHATLEINGKTFVDRVSGCGYDKLSSVVACVLEKCPSFRRFKIENWKKIKNRLPEYNSNYIHWNENDIFPCFGIDGSGISVLRQIVEAAGYTFEHYNHDKYENIYIYK